ncbi:hypothetical protein BDQ17DRAFT_1433508 [Cyathus striatus]|nr:hypothetical protein BDQ17DRAFT_1433508 [Cyathus striatus]
MRFVASFAALASTVAFATAANQSARQADNQCTADNLGGCRDALQARFTSDTSQPAPASCNISSSQLANIGEHFL